VSVRRATRIPLAAAAAPAASRASDIALVRLVLYYGIMILASGGLGLPPRCPRPCSVLLRSVACRNSFGQQAWVTVTVPGPADLLRRAPAGIIEPESVSLARCSAANRHAQRKSRRSGRLGCALGGVRYSFPPSRPGPVLSPARLQVSTSQMFSHGASALPPSQALHPSLSLSLSFQGTDDAGLASSSITMMIMLTRTRRRSRVLIATDSLSDSESLAP
jgi:hypothetical protein